MFLESSVSADETASKKTHLTPTLKKALRIASYEAISPRYLLSRMRYIGLAFLVSLAMVALGVCMIVFGLTGTSELRITSVLFVSFGSLFALTAVVASIIILMRAYLSQYALSTFSSEDVREASCQAQAIFDKLDQLRYDASFGDELANHMQLSIPEIKGSEGSKTRIAGEVIGLVKHRLGERDVA